MTSESAPRGAKTKRPKKKPGCPVCGRPMERAFRPFCSRRCKEVDLGRWVSGAYRIPSEEAPGEGADGNAEDNRD